MIDLTLNNGLRITALNRSGFKSASVTAYVNYGTAHESKNESAHLLEHILLDNVSEDLPKIGSYTHGKTFLTYTTYYFPFYFKYANEAADLITKLLSKSSFNEDNLNKEKKSVLRELSRVQDSPFLAFNHKVTDVLFRDKIRKTLYEEISVTESMTLDILSHTYNANYVPSRVHIFAYGAVDEEKIAERLKNNLGDYKEDLESKNTKLTDLKDTPEKETKYNFSSSLVGTCFVLPGTDHFGKNPHEYYSFLMAFNGIIKRLEDVLKNKGLIYEGQSIEQIFDGAGYCWYFAPVNKKDTAETRKIMSKELDNIYKNGFERSEFSHFKNRTLLDYAEEQGDKEEFSINFLKFKNMDYIKNAESSDNIIEGIQKEDFDKAISTYLSKGKELVINGE